MVLLLINAVCACSVNSISIKHTAIDADYTTNVCEASIESRDEGYYRPPITDLTLNSEEGLEKTICGINDRVDWIIERLWSDPIMRNEYTASEFFTPLNVGAFRDLYDGNCIVYRLGAIEYIERLEGGISYELFYDKEGRFVYAEITQYRDQSYFIYFFNDEFVSLTTGARENNGFRTLNESMVNAIMICFENAYKTE